MCLARRQFTGSSSSLELLSRLAPKPSMVDTGLVVNFRPKVVAGRVPDSVAEISGT